MLLFKFQWFSALRASALFIAVCSIFRGRSSMLSSKSRRTFGVLVLHLVIMCWANVCIVVILVDCDLLMFIAQTTEQYVIFGIIIVLYIHIICLGVSPHFLPIALLTATNVFLHFNTVSLMCSFQLSLSSMMTPKYLTDWIISLH